MAEAPDSYRGNAMVKIPPSPPTPEGVAVHRPAWMADAGDYCLTDTNGRWIEENWAEYDEPRDLIALRGEVVVEYRADAVIMEVAAAEGFRATVAAGIAHRVRGRGLFESILAADQRQAKGSRKEDPS
jgi:hypothetical protein